MPPRTDEEAQHLVGNSTSNGNNEDVDDGFTRFCNRLGIALDTRRSGPIPQIHGSIFQDVIQKRREYRVFYILLLMVAIIAVISQIALGLIISALSGINAAHYKVPIIILGALNSFIGFVSAWIQYQGQPTRAGQFSSALDEVRTEIMESHGEMKNKGSTAKAGDDLGVAIRNLYKQAIADALANQPNVWSRGGDRPGLRGPNPPASNRSMANRTESNNDDKSGLSQRLRPTEDSSVDTRPT